MPREPGISIETAEDRYSRLRMIPWWDQDLLARSKVLVIGAGALGNEIIKDLALLGIGSIAIVDFDTVETTNLSRSMLYSTSDQGKPKADAAAAAARSINPDCRIHAIDADVTRGLGVGAFRWADMVICGLDNREARLAVNRACWKAGRPWVDGATESFQGVARVFVPPDGVCYECTLSEQDQRVIEARNSCGFLAREAYRQGRTPTTPTTSAVIAGIEVQEAIKLLHGESSNLAGRGFFFDGASYDCFTMEYQRRDDCLSHETFDNIIECGLDSGAGTLEQVAAVAREHLGYDEVILDLPDEMVTGLRCTHCGSQKELFRLLRAVEPEDTKCAGCGVVMVPDVTAEWTSDCDFGLISLRELGFPVMEIIAARSGDRTVQIEISGDAAILFGSGV